MRGGGGWGWGLCAGPWVPEDSGNVLGWGLARGWRWAAKTEGGAGPPGDVWVRPRPGLGERPPEACSPRAPRGLVSPAGPSRAPSCRVARSWAGPAPRRTWALDERLRRPAPRSLTWLLCKMGCYVAV